MDGNGNLRAWDGQIHHAIGSAARDMMDRPEEEAGLVLSTAKSYLALYRDPVVARSVSRSDFRIRHLMHGNDPISLYIVTQPNDKARLRPLVRVMVNMIVRLLADKMDFKGGRPMAHYQHRLLMMLDEFPKPRAAGDHAGIASLHRRLWHQVLPHLGHQPAQEP